MFLGALFLLCLITVPLSGGRLSALGDIRLRGNALIAIALHWRQWYAWLYTAIGTAVLLTSPYYSALFHRGIVEGTAHVSHRTVPAYAATACLVFLLFGVTNQRIANVLRVWPPAR